MNMLNQKQITDQVVKEHENKDKHQSLTVTKTNRLLSGKNGSNLAHVVNNANEAHQASQPYILSKNQIDFKNNEMMGQASKNRNQGKDVNTPKAANHYLVEAQN